jgi:Putative porin
LNHLLTRAVLVAALAAYVPGVTHAAADEERHLNELRNTIGNLLQALVDRGVITREQAEGMVKDAQAKAEADANATQAANDAEEKADAAAGAVRVPYVPEVVKDEIRKEVVADLTPAVTKEVIDQATSSDALARALPDWVRRMRWTGDMRVRAQSDTFAPDNVQNFYLDVLKVNSAGGITRAGPAALINTTEDRERLRARLRLGVEMELGWGWTAAARLTTGSLTDPVSTNQTLGNYGNRYQIGLDQAYLRWTGQTDTGRQQLGLTAGRMPNPWMSTDLIWDQDLSFEGVSANYRYSISRDDPFRRNFFATIGAFPLTEVEISSKDKYLFGGQMGVDWRTTSGGRLRFGAAYYDFQNIAGVRNEPNSTLNDFTAPTFVQRGNTLYDIRNNPTDPTQDLFALATEFQVLDIEASAEWLLSERHRLSLAGSYVDNLGYEELFGPGDFVIRMGANDDPRTKGYQVEAAFGRTRMNEQGAWRVALSYRYLERDAVLDAFTDSDFRLGGTDVQGYVLNVDYSFTPRVLARLRYLSGSEIDGPPLGIDVLQLDVNASF